VDVLDGLRVGGGRNYGFGELSLAETQVIDLDDLDYSRVREADNVQLELLSPYVLQSDSPGLTVSRCRGGGSLTGSFVAGRVGSWPVMSVMSWQ